MRWRGPDAWRHGVLKLTDADLCIEKVDFPTLPVGARITSSLGPDNLAVFGVVFGAPEEMPLRRLLEARSGVW
jgi:hypothetical protein